MREDGGGGDEGGKYWRRSAGLRIVGAVLILLVSLFAVVLTWLGGPLTRRTTVTSGRDCLECHRDLAASLGKRSVHQPFKKKACTVCHAPHGKTMTLESTRAPSGLPGPVLTIVRWSLLGRLVEAVLGPEVFETREGDTRTVAVKSGRSVLRMPEDELCWTCHEHMARLTGLPSRHPPFARGQCGSCHDPHASSHETLLLQETPDLCAACHRVVSDIAKSVVHYPFGTRQCTACHDPHASRHEGVLRASERDLCFSCHPQTASQSSRAVQHQPFAIGRCTGCHEPHSSMNGALLSVSAPYLCYSCHPSVASEVGKASSHPLRSGDLRCQDCHEPHASEHDAILVKAQKELCLGCHRGVGAQQARSLQHAPFSGRSCTACHVPHGSDHDPLLVSGTPGLCYRCHPGVRSQLALASTHPVGARIDCGDCHEPHASDHSGMLVRVQRALCLGCHTAASGELRLTALHQPFALSECTVCHLPHGSRHAPLLARGQADLCFSCHTAPAKRAIGRRSHGGGCSACHRAHASPYPDLLFARGDRVCTTCHTLIVRAGFDASPHKRLGCSCHDVHGGSEALLDVPQLALCRRCHSRPYGINKHPHGPEDTDPLTGTRMSCTSSCHAVHGSANNHQLKFPYNQRGFGSDYICLQCHRGVGVLY